MKSIFKLLLYMLIGAIFGFIILVPLLALIKGESLTSILQWMFSARFVPVILYSAAILLGLLVAALLQIVIHEGGHLVAGLMGGYRFVSFRFLNFTLIKQNGRLLWRNYELDGTGGQCLLAPSDKPLGQIDSRWYNAGGVLANIITAAIAILLIVFLDMPKWLDAFLMLLAMLGIFSAIMNGIPMKAGGVANDGMNLFQLEKDPPCKQCFVNILDANARIQEGEQYKDMPEQTFALPDPFDWKNSMHTGNLMLVVNRMMNLHQWEEAYRLLTDTVNHKDDIMALYQIEFECMMTVVCIAMGRDDEARGHYDDKVSKYAARYVSTQSDKQLVVMATALALDGDRPKAEQMLRQLETDRDKYIHQGEVAMSIDIMRWLLDNHTAQQ